MKGGAIGLMLLKRLVCFLIALLLVSGTFPAFAESAESTYVEPTLSSDAQPYDEEHPENLDADQLIAHSAILIEASSGQVIFEKNPDEPMYPASTTKILTTLLGIMMTDESEMNQTVLVSDEAMNIAADSSTMGLSAGEEINFTDLLFGTMLLSANEGANVIAEAVSGDIQSFVDLMNETAAIFGCTNTHFANPHGYHDVNHFTTARDMAIIAREAMQNDQFRAIANTTQYQLARTNLQRARTIRSKHEIQLPGTEESPNKYFYPYATGIKTGFHSAAANCFVGSAERDGVELISVVFYTSRRGRWTDTKKLFEYGFSQYVSVTPIDLYNMNPITLETNNYSLDDVSMGKLRLTCVPTDGTRTARITATQDDVDLMAKNLKQTVLIEYTRDFAAPIEAGEIMGVMTYFPEDDEPVEYNLIASRSIRRRENAPLTLEEILALVENDPNPFPPITLELILTLCWPLIALWILLRVLKRVFHRRRVRNARVPKPKSRYLK